jgi:ribosomal protein L14E/L6E/L27E
VVQSVAGRDEGTLYVIWACPDPRYILVTDGRLHPSTKPKKKNKKHVATKRYLCDIIAGACTPGSVLDAEIRKFLKDVTQNQFHKEEG